MILNQLSSGEESSTRKASSMLHQGQDNALGCMGRHDIARLRLSIQIVFFRHDGGKKTQTETSKVLSVRVPRYNFILLPGLGKAPFQSH